MSGLYLRYELCSLQALIRAFCAVSSNVNAYASYVAAKLDNEESFDSKQKKNSSFDGIHRK